MKKEIIDWYSRLKLRLKLKSYENKIKMREKLIKLWKPEILDKWKATIEEQVHKEYEQESELLGDEIQKLKHDLSQAISERDKYLSKYEAAIEVQDKLLTKVEKTSTKTGELKNEVKQLNNVIVEIKESSLQEPVVED